MHPLHGQSITLDPVVSAAAQALLVWVAAPADAIVEVRLDHGDSRLLRFPFELLIPLRRGAHTLSARLVSSGVSADHVSAAHVSADHVSADHVSFWVR